MPIRVETFTSCDEAARALGSEHRARVLAGGTLVMRAVNAASPHFDRLIRITDPVLREVRAEGERIVIGSHVTMAQVMAHRDLAFLAPAARVIGGPAVRAAATIGGNLHARSPFGDFAAALIALGATVQVAGGSAPVAAEDFVRDRATQRIVRSVSVPRVTDPRALRFRKVTRVKPVGESILSIAVYTQANTTRVAYGNMGPHAVRVPAVEQALQGARLDEAGIARALAVATEGLSPPDDALASAWYRREVAPVHLARTLLGRA